VDDHSRFCVVARAMPRATARPVCEAFARREQLVAKSAVEPLDLAGCGWRSDGREQVADPVLVADPVEQDLMPGAGVAPSEHATVVRQDRLGYPIGPKRRIRGGLSSRAQACHVRRV
jgi:hypothetical protein